MHGDRLDGERLVQLHQVDVADLQAGPLQHLADGAGPGRCPSPRGRSPETAKPRTAASGWRPCARANASLVTRHGGRAVGERRRGAGGDGAVAPGTRAPAPPAPRRSSSGRRQPSRSTVRSPACTGAISSARRPVGLRLGGLALRSRRRTPPAARARRRSAARRARPSRPSTCRSAGSDSARPGWGRKLKPTIGTRDIDSMPARHVRLAHAHRDRAGGGVHGLHGRAAEAVDGGAGDAAGQSRQHADDAADVHALLALREGAADRDVLDRARVDAGALDAAPARPGRRARRGGCGRARRLCAGWNGERT